MKFRKKPVVIDAFQLVEGQPWPDGVQFHERCEGNGACSLDGQMYVQTLEGPLVAKYGDWIITGVKGEKYPCKPDIFSATYEPAE